MSVFIFLTWKHSKWVIRVIEGKKKERNEKFSLAKNFKSKNFTLGNAMAVVVYGVRGVYD